jgi:hypothetical protein
MIHVLSAAWSVAYIFFFECLVYGWRKVEAGLKKCKTNIIISVHPIMQHIPMWVLKCQGLQNRVVFVTVITDLNTCHLHGIFSYWQGKHIIKQFFHLIWQLEGKKRRGPCWCEQMLLPLRRSCQAGCTGWSTFSNPRVRSSDSTIILPCSSC